MYNSNSNAVIERIKSIRTHKQAVACHNKIKPIKGRSVECRPLADRRADHYNIRMNGDKVECVLYQTPVLTFLPDNTVEIRMGGWNSGATRTFIMEILGLSCGNNMGTPMLSLDRDRHVVLDSKDVTVIRNVGGDAFLHWELVSSVDVFEWKMNKAKANIVRAKYSEFEAYFRNMIKLRKEQKIYGVVPVEVVTFSMQEFKDSGVLIEGEINRWTVAAQKGHTRYHYLNETLMELMANGQPEEKQIKCFYVAVMAIVSTMIHTGHINRTLSLATSVDSLLPKFRELVYKWHSDEIFERTLLPVGKAPSPRYSGWVNKVE